jgi:hypothetical protein
MRVLGLTCVSSHTCLGLVCLFISLAQAAAIGAVDVEFKSTRECPAALDVTGAISNETLYAEVAAWSHGKAKDWTYEPVSADARAGLARAGGLTEHEAEGANFLVSCVKVQYSSLLEIPEPLKGLLELLRISVDVEVKIKKTVCEVGRLVVEDVEVEAPIVEDTRIRTRTEASDRSLSSVSQMHLRVPWWATVLEAQIADAMRRLVSEKLDAVMATRCSGGALQQRRLLQAGARGGFMRRALERPGGFGKSHPLKPLEPRMPKVAQTQNLTEAWPPEANATGGLVALVVEELLVLPIAAANAAQEIEEEAEKAMEGAETHVVVSPSRKEEPTKSLRGVAALTARRDQHAKTLFTLRRRELAEKTMQNARVY